MAIIKTPTGLIHTASEGFYSGEVAESGVMPVAEVKRGRGRPRKNTGASGASYDFSAFLTKIVIPKFKGNSRVYIKSV